LGNNQRKWGGSISIIIGGGIMASDLIGKKIRLVLSNNFHYTGRVIDENEKTLTIIDQKGVEVKISKYSIIIQEEVLNGN